MRAKEDVASLLQRIQTLEKKIGKWEKKAI